MVARVSLLRCSGRRLRFDIDCGGMADAATWITAPYCVLRVYCSLSPGTALAQRKHLPRQGMRTAQVVSTQLHLEDFPNSAYALELRRNAWDMRFGSPLESEFTVWYVERMHLRAKVWFSLSVLLTVFFTIRRAGMVGALDWQVLLHIFVLTPCVAILAWLSWTKSFARRYLPSARILAPIYFVAVAALIPIGMARGDNQMAGLTVNMMAVLSFSGLMFRDSLVTAALMIVAFTLCALAMALPVAMLIPSVVILVLTALVSATVQRDAEKSYRTGFLERALIGELVARDGLTGLMNRRTFDDHLLRVWQCAQRERRSMAVLLIDIDHFKEYNDGFGHQAGDLALRRVARNIEEFARRPLDLAARFGGEEFAVVLYDLALSDVLAMAERICRSIQSLQIRRSLTEAASEAVTISVGGGVVVPSVGRTPEGAVQLADEALYEAKRTGRNRVVVRGSDEYRLLDTGEFKSSKAAG
jgi:diguanylate cyclase (GGDEF)-like protein